MKYLIVALIVLFFSCKHSNEERAKSAVKEFIKQNVNDPSSYQPGEFSIEPVTVEIPEHKRQLDSLIKLMASGKITPRELSEQDSILSKKYEDKMLSGWNITHAYRTKNKLGALVGEEADFFVDREYHVTIKGIKR
jgi:hypothetical protein